MARGHLTRSPSGHLTRQTGRSPDSPSGSTFTLADGLTDFLVSGRARGLSPKTLDWYAMIGERFAAFRTSRGADPALIAANVAEARAFVVSLQEAGLAPSSVAGFVRGLRAFSAWCAAEGLVAEDPLRRLPRAAGFSIDEKLIDRWVVAGLIDQAQTRGRGRGRGVGRFWSDNQRQGLLSLLEKHRTARNLRTLTNVPVLVWAIWGEDFVPLTPPSPPTPPQRLAVRRAAV